jgi:hypothetical protein
LTDIQKGQVAWFCQPCSPIAKNILKGLSDMNVKYDKLLDRVAKLESKPPTASNANANYTELLNRVAKLEANPSGNVASNGDGSGNGSGLSVEDLVAKTVSATISEMHEVKRRENNVVIFGMIEDDTPDQSKVEGILAAIGLATDMISHCMRLGRANGPRPRLVRVRFSTVEFKHSVLNAAKLLRDKGYPGIYIKPDMTPREVTEHRELVSRMKAANANGRVVRISRGKLVPLNDQGLFQPSAAS